MKEEAILSFRISLSLNLIGEKKIRDEGRCLLSLFGKSSGQQMFLQLLPGTSLREVLGEEG